jgi:hypothetical protein
MTRRMCHHRRLHQCECVLLAVNGAVLGLDSDICESKQIPSWYCSIFGLRPGQGGVALTSSAGTSFGVDGVVGHPPVLTHWVASLLFILSPLAFVLPQIRTLALKLSLSGPMGCSVMTSSAWHVSSLERAVAERIISLCLFCTET